MWRVDSGGPLLRDAHQECWTSPSSAGSPGWLLCDPWDLCAWPYRSSLGMDPGSLGWVKLGGAGRTSPKACSDQPPVGRSWTTREGEIFKESLVFWGGVGCRRGGVGGSYWKGWEGALSHQPVGDWNLPVWQLHPYKIEDPRMVPNRVFAGKMRLPWHYQHIPQDSIIRLSPRRNEKMSGERKWARKSPPLWMLLFPPLTVLNLSSLTI